MTKLMWCASALLFVAACSGGGGGSLLGDDPGGVSQQGPTTVAPLVQDARVDLPGKVSVFVQVLNGDGTPAPDLTPSAFRIYENNQPVSQSESQQQLRPRPQVFRSYTHLILDRSNSVQQSPEAIAAQKEGAKRYVEVVTAQSPESYVKVSWFDGQAELHEIAGHDVGFSNDLIALCAAIDALDAEPPFSPSTNLYGSVIEALDDLDEVDLEAIAEGIPYRALTLVTFTDGTHQAGPIATLAQARARLDEEDGERYAAFTIGLGSEIDPLVLNLLGPDGAEFADEIADLEPRFEAVGEGVRALANSFYLLAYCSPKTIGNHQLRVSVRPERSPQDAKFPFSATYFGAGCGFLDVYGIPALAGASKRTVITDAVEDAEGRVVICGWRADTCTSPGCVEEGVGFVARLLADPVAPNANLRLDARLDTTFGAGGIVLLSDAGAALTGASALVLGSQPDELLVGGWSRTAPSARSEASVWRIAAGGASVLRTSILNPTTVDQVLYDLARDGLGRLIAVGSRGTAVRASAVWALDEATLVLDPSFNSDGVFVHPENPTTDADVATDVVIDALGRIVVVGEGFSASAPSWNQNRDLKLLVLDPMTGAPDPGFAGGGIAYGLGLFAGVPLPGRPETIAVDAQNRIVIGGALLESVAEAIREQPVLYRALESGIADTTFAGSVGSRFPGSGVVTLRTGSTDQPDIDFGRDAAINALVVEAAGGILANGWRSNADEHLDVALFGFGADGVPASNYNVVGFLIEDGSSADDSFEAAHTLLVHSTGAVWTLGSSRPALGAADVPTVWVDRDPKRTYPPLGIR